MKHSGDKSDCQDSKNVIPHELGEVYRPLFENLSDAIFVADCSTRILVDCNRKAEELLECPRDEILKMTADQLHPADVLQATMGYFAKYAAGESNLCMETVLISKTGCRIPVSINACRMKFAGRDCLIGAFRDITAQKQAEEERHRLETILNFAVEQTPVPMVLVSIPEKTLLCISRAAKTFLDIGDEESFQENTTLQTFKQSWKDYDIDGQELPIEQMPLALAMSGKKTISQEYSIVTKNGVRRFELVTAMPIYNDAGKQIAAFAVFPDITDLKIAEESLRKSQQQLERQMLFLDALMAAIPVPVFYKDAHGKYLGCNDAYSEVVGISKEGIKGKTVFDLWPAELAEIYHKKDIELLQNPTIQIYEAKIKNKDGELRDVVFRKGVFRNEKGEIAGTIGAHFDITERKQNEEQKLQMERQMLHVQKLESLGILAGGMAHDFNNILMAILGYADLTLMQMSPTSPGRENLQEIVQASHKAANLCSQMLAYSGRGKFVVGNIQINTLVSEMAHLLKAAISKKIALNLNLQENLPTIEGDATQIHQVVMNLITNASEAIGDAEGTIRFSTGTMLCTKNDFADAILADATAEGRYVYLEVSDTGCGMDKATINRIFEPFFTTKFTGRGLGMAAVLGIIKGHKGAIKIISEIRKGTTFQVFFHAAKKSATPSQSVADGNPKSWKGSGTVLLVDDEEYVQKIGRKMLENTGLDVIVASNGKDAIDIYRQQKDKISLVLLDLTMPVMNGQETFELLLRIDPSVKAILTSGYTEYEISARFGEHAPAGFLQKPFTSEKLASLIKSVLEKGKQ